MATFLQRMLGAARLDAATYEDVEADRTATGQALGVVVLSAVCAGVGAMGSDAGAWGVVALTLGALAGWYAWAVATWLIGTRMLPEPETKADLGELLRTIGFSASPGVLRIAALLPLVGELVAVVAWFWMLGAMIVAVRQALDYRSTWRAAFVCVIGFFVQVGVIFAFMLLFGVGALALGILPGTPGG